MTTSDFFEEPTEASLMKMTLVTKYFPAWANVVRSKVRNRGKKLGYIDLFAGPGRYQDGTPSTPLRVLELALENDELREMLVCVFNDENEQYLKTLQNQVAKFPGIGRLQHTPEYLCMKIGEEVLSVFERMATIPSLVFIDPWGYKGLTLELIASAIKDWGCDCLFFLNYNRINMALGNPKFADHVNALFGVDNADQLRLRIPELSPKEREAEILRGLEDAVRSLGTEFLIPFAFDTSPGGKTSHHVFFVTKHQKGYDIMKSIMAKLSSSSDQGVPSLRFNPAEKSQPTLFDLTAPLDELATKLLEHFAGCELTMRQVYQDHGVRTNYTDSNYKDALKILEDRGQIVADPPKDRRPNGTFADKVTVTFPSQETPNGRPIGN